MSKKNAAAKRRNQDVFLASLAAREKNPAKCGIFYKKFFSSFKW